ncbi:MAG: SDR family oxidoreductase, partial [Candidatus Eremiobacteraeota bacterium]|nr:SDR family oxidoreductase [Candidatus Eremiobacteraeota bacterium]
MNLQISGKCALVTGASAGIGRGIALALAKEGVRLALAARRADLLADVAQEIADAGGPAPAVFATDVTAEDAAQALATHTLAALERVEILVNCAGGSRPLALDAPEDAWDEAIALNFTSHRRLTHALLPSMIAQGWGRIINITGKSEPEGLNAAFAAKAAMHAWAKGLSREVGRFGITVNSIPPGKIISEQILRNYSPEVRARESEEAIPVGEYGQPEDIANLVCFLASPLARYITGAVIPV